MTKSALYSMLFTVFLWLGGIMPFAQTTAAPRTVSASAPAPTVWTLLTQQQPADVHVAAAQPAAPEAHGQNAHAGEEEGDADLMAIKPATFIWELILFVILLIALGKYVWPPILQGLQQREAKIRGDLEQAEQARNQAATTLEEYKQQLAQAQKQAQQIIEQSRGDARKVADQMREQAQADLAQMRKRAEADIHAAKEQAVADIYDQAAGLATQVAGQILQREIRPEDHQTLVRQSLGGLERVAS